MSGHSKWSQIKHQKASVDKQKGLLFTKLAQAITLGVRKGNGISNPQANFHLRLAIEKAREKNMPSENITKAILRGTSSLSGGEALEEHIYEGFAPGKVPVLVRCATSNKQRTHNDLHNIFYKSGGTLTGVGSVSYMFKFCGVIEHDRTGQSFDWYLEKALKSGAADIEVDRGRVVFFTQAHDLHAVGKMLEKEGISVKSYQLKYLPLNKIKIDPLLRDQYNQFINSLHEYEDVLDIYEAVL